MQVLKVKEEEKIVQRRKKKQLCVLAVRGVAGETDYCVLDSVCFQNLPARVHFRKTLKNWLTHQQRSNVSAGVLAKGIFVVMRH